MIRKFKNTDTQQIIDIWYQASFVAHPFLDAVFLKKEEKNIRDIYLPNTETWVFENDDQVIGFIALMGNEVGAIFVRPEYHGHGFGTKLMDYVGQFHEVLEVEVFEKNAIGRTFYDKYGFKLIKEHIHKETNFKLLRMRYSR